MRGCKKWGGDFLEEKLNRQVRQQRQEKKKFSSWRPCMFKTPPNRSISARRVRVTTSVARSHADTTTGPRPIAFRPAAAAAKRGPSRSRVASPEQPTELSPSPRGGGRRSHLQGRDARMTPDPSQPVSPAVFVGIDVAKDKLD